VRRSAGELACGEAARSRGDGSSPAEDDALFCRSSLRFCCSRLNSRGVSRFATELVGVVLPLWRGDGEAERRPPPWLELDDVVLRISAGGRKECCGGAAASICSRQCAVLCGIHAARRGARVRISPDFA